MVVVGAEVGPAEAPSVVGLRESALRVEASGVGLMGAVVERLPGPVAGLGWEPADNVDRVGAIRLVLRVSRSGALALEAVREEGCGGL